MTDRPATDEHELVRAAQRGDRGAGAELVRRHERALWLFLWRMTSCRQSAEDLFQEVWLRSWKGIAGFRSEASFGTYLLRVARNLVIDRSRPRPAAASVSDLDPVDPARPGCWSEAEEGAETVERLLAALAPRQREALVLRHLHGLRYREVAEVMGIGEATARGYAHEGLAEASRLAGRETG